MPSEKLVDAITNLREEESVAITAELLEQGTDPLDILEDCREGMTIIGGRFERQEAFLPELMMAGEILKAISDLIKPRMAAGPQQERLGKVVIGTVQGDIHDIAKDIVVFMLDINVLQYYTQTKLAVNTTQMWIGLVHSVVVGALIALAGCLRGMQCGRSASAVGDATTSAVVTGITSIIIATAIITYVCNVLGI